MLFPACTGLGAAVIVTTMLALVAAPTRVKTLAVLFARLGSLVPDETDAVSRICVPFTVPGITCTTTVKVPTAAFATSGSVQLIFPALPTAGVVHDQPVAIASD